MTVDRFSFRRCSADVPPASVWPGPGLVTHSPHEQQSFFHRFRRTHTMSLRKLAVHARVTAQGLTLRCAAAAMATKEATGEVAAIAKAAAAQVAAEGASNAIVIHDWMHNYIALAVTAIGTAVIAGYGTASTFKRRLKEIDEQLKTAKSNSDTAVAQAKTDADAAATKAKAAADAAAAQAKEDAYAAAAQAKEAAAQAKEDAKEAKREAKEIAAATKVDAEKGVASAKEEAAKAKADAIKAVDDLRAMIEKDSRSFAENAALKVLQTYNVRFYGGLYCLQHGMTCAAD